MKYFLRVHQGGHGALYLKRLRRFSLDSNLEQLEQRAWMFEYMFA